MERKLDTNKWNWEGSAYTLLNFIVGLFWILVIIIFFIPALIYKHSVFLYYGLQKKPKGGRSDEGRYKVWIHSLTGKKHRLDGPAVIFDDYKAWYQNGKLHRDDGPAIEGDSSLYSILWGWKGQRFETFQEWATVSDIPEDQKILLKFQYSD